MISIIIPTLNEEEHLADLLDNLLAEPGDKEILVVDSGSRDQTVAVATSRPGVRVGYARRGRSWQMNHGADLAQGDILLFLHADTTLQAGWYRAVRQTMEDPSVLLGAFRFKVNDPSIPFRLIECGVRWRCRLTRLPYGDQALFMRRQDFLNMDGYPPIPFLEDVDLVRRCRTKGHIRLLPLTASSSARNWHRHGPLRQTWKNWSAYYRYRHGTPIHELYQSYYGPRRAIVLFCKWPEPGAVKTRLAATVGDDQAVAVYRNLVYSTLVSVRQSESKADCWICFSPHDARAAFEEWFDASFLFQAQRDGDLGDRMLAAFEQGKRDGYDEILIVGTDCPGLHSSHIDQAFASLANHELALGPTEDGGYYLIAAHKPHPELFQNMTWSVDTVFSETRKRAEQLGLTCATLDCLRDMDTEHDIRSLVDQDQAHGRSAPDL